MPGRAPKLLDSNLQLFVSFSTSLSLRIPAAHSNPTFCGAGMLFPNYDVDP